MTRSAAIRQIQDDFRRQHAGLELHYNPATGWSVTDSSGNAAAWPAGVTARTLDAQVDRLAQNGGGNGNGNNTGGWFRNFTRGATVGAAYATVRHASHMASEAVGQAVHGGGEVVAGATAAGAAIVMAIVGSFLQAFGASGQGVQQIVSALTKTVSTIFTAVFDGTIRILRAGVQVAGFAAAMVPVAVGFLGGLLIGNPLMGAAVGAAIASLLVNVITGVATQIGGILGALGAVFRAFGEAARTALEGVGQIFKDTIGTLVGYARSVRSMGNWGGVSQGSSESALNNLSSIGVSNSAVAGFYAQPQNFSLFSGPRLSAYGGMYGAGNIGIGRAFGSDPNDILGWAKGFEQSRGSISSQFQFQTSFKAAFGDGEMAVQLMDSLSMGLKRLRSNLEFAKSLNSGPQALEQAKDFEMLKDRFSTFVDFLKRSLGSALLPTAIAWMNFIVQYMKENQGKIVAFFKEIGRWLYVELPYYIGTAVRWFLEAVQFVARMAPIVVDAVANIFTAIMAWLQNFWTAAQQFYSSTVVPLINLLIGFANMFSARPIPYVPDPGSPPASGGGSGSGSSTGGSGHGQGHGSGGGGGNNPPGHSQNNQQSSSPNRNPVPGILGILGTVVSAIWNNLSGLGKAIVGAVVAFRLFIGTLRMVNLIATTITSVVEALEALGTTIAGFTAAGAAVSGMFVALTAAIIALEVAAIAWGVSYNRDEERRAQGLISDKDQDFLKKSNNQQKADFYRQKAEESRKDADDSGGFLGLKGLYRKWMGGNDGKDGANAQAASFDAQAAHYEKLAKADGTATNNNSGQTPSVGSAVTNAVSNIQQGAANAANGKPAPAGTIWGTIDSWAGNQMQSGFLGALAQMGTPEDHARRQADWDKMSRSIDGLSNTIGNGIDINAKTEVWVNPASGFAESMIENEALITWRQISRGGGS